MKDIQQFVFLVVPQTMNSQWIIGAWIGNKFRLLPLITLSLVCHSGEDLDDLALVLRAMSAPDLRTLAKSYHFNPMGQQKGQIILALVAKSQQSTVASLFGQKVGGVRTAMLKRWEILIQEVFCFQMNCFLWCFNFFLIFFKAILTSSGVLQLHHTTLALHSRIKQCQLHWKS